MTQQLLSGLIAYAFVTSITPGPNNLMLMTSGANYGFRRTVPHMLGVSLGFVLMAAVLGAGLVQLFSAFPVSYMVLKILSVIYMIWLAWKIANTAATPDPAKGTSQSITFLQACAFQWVNPKAVAMALTALTNYAPDHSFSASLLVCAIFGAVNLPSVGSWVLVGQQMQRLLTSQTRLRSFNITMALLLLASLYPVLRA